MIIMIYREFLASLTSDFGDDWIPVVVFIGFAVLGFVILYTKQESEKAEKKVVKNSDFYQSVLELNEYTKYHPEIAQEGKVCYVMHVDSKAEFDGTTVKEALYEYLTLYGSEMWDYLRMVSENREAYRAYESAFEKIHSSITREKCRSLGIGYDRFLSVEKDLVASKKLKMIQKLSITCKIKYDSPNGQNTCKKSDTYSESEIRTAMQNLIEKENYSTREDWQRKYEHRVTPSMRYDVMQRDGFKCCLCGRSAGNGVELEVDHIVPVFKGGNTTYSNLQTLCRECNRGKGAKMLE